MKVMVTDRRGGQVRHLVVEAPPGALRGDGSGSAPPDGATQLPGPGLHHGQDLSGGSGTDPPDLRVSGGVPRIVVAAGPDAGTSYPLAPGRWVSVGRDPCCHLTIHDPSLSRRHLRVRLDREHVRVEDLGSTNGLVWESGVDSPVWPAEDRLLLGRSVLVLLARPAPPLATRDADGRRLVTPWPRNRPAVDAVELTSPPPPRPRTVRRPSAWVWALPLLIALLVAVVLRMPWLLLFGLLGPAMVLGHHLGDRRAARDEHREAVANHTETCRQICEAGEMAQLRELCTLRAADAGAVGLVEALSAGPTTRLWECGDEEPRVVLGETAQVGSVVLDGAPARHERAPLAIELTGPLVLTGTETARDGLLRSVLLQLVTRHPPDRLAVLVDPDRLPGPGWDLVAWLPHTRLVVPRATAHVVRWGTDLVVVDDARDTPSDLPRVVLHDTGHAVLQRPGEPDVPFHPTLLGLRTARRLARRLAPLQVDRDSRSAAQEGPGVTPLGRLLPWPRQPASAHGLWGRPSLSVPLGQAPDGSVQSIDLATDGPHALIAGTTGSGKSELLRTLVVGLALNNSPADLSLLLIDYKGGSSLGACAALPHVTGLVTDLDPHLAERVLLSLQAELTRREHVLQEAGARDIREHKGPGMPRLVVVIDEFRVLAEEVPQVMEGLVRVAAVGRSLGVHLVLATQRPAGVVGADLRANVNLRIALRVRDTADSYDVLECADAAALPEGRPGLALLRTGASPPRTVQVAVARPDVQASHGRNGWRVSEHPDVWSARIAMEETTRADQDEDVDDPVLALGGVLTGHAGRLGLSAERVWLPPLPAELDPDPRCPEAWAVADLPAEQRRAPLVWAGGHHIGIVGSARSGRTTALRSLLRRSAAWTVVLDLGSTLSGGGLDPADPRCCAWVGPDEQAHCLRVLDLLAQVVQDRQSDPGRPREPVVLAVDGWDRFVDQLGHVEGGRGVEVARRILREGPAVGVVGLVSGDRSLLLGAMAALLPETWLLRLNDPNDLMLTGLRPSQLPREQPPGRMLRGRDGVVAQVVLPPEGGAAEGPLPSGQDTAGQDSSGQLAMAGEQEATAGQVTTGGRTTTVGAGAGQPGLPPLRCIALPRRWEAPDRLCWAVGGDAAEPVDLPDGAVLVLGPPGSGRTQALRALADAHGGATVTVEGADPPSADRLAQDLAGLGIDDLVSVDDAQLLSGTPVEDLLVAHAARHRARVHVAADLDGAAGAFRGLVPQLARTRTALILQPTTPGDGASVGVQLPVGDLRVPGRGVLVRRGRATRVQVIAPKAPGSTPNGSQA